MHACAHDSHMAILVGAARRLAAMKDSWSGHSCSLVSPRKK